MFDGRTVASSAPYSRGLPPPSRRDVDEHGPEAAPMMGVHHLEGHLGRRRGRS